MKRTMRLFCFVLSISMASSGLFGQSNGFPSAFDAMHQVFSKYYPFSHWKAIKWDELNARIRPKIVSAGNANDSVAFYLAIREYANSVPDGHIAVHGWEKFRETAKYRLIGGSYGFVLVRLDDGRMVSRLVDPGSPADLAGMQFGATILQVNDQPVNAALDTVSVLFGEDIPATMEYRKLQQSRLIGRAMVGKPMKVKFLNRGAADPVTATLAAADDNYKTYDQTSMIVLDPGPVVSGKIIHPENFGYIKLTMEHGEDSAQAKKIFTDFRDLVANFNSNGARGMIIDLRVNAGGEDALSAAIAGLFINDTTFYEYWGEFFPLSDSIGVYQQMMPLYKPMTTQQYYNPSYPLGSLYIEPQGTCFSNPVVVLIGPRNKSSGEGIPLALRELANCKILGFHGTNGSFGVNAYEPSFFAPPQDLTLKFPWGVSLDKNKKIQLDSDSTMTGGIVPEIRVPVNDSVIDELYIDSTDVEVNWAIRELNTMLGMDDPAGKVNALLLEQNVPNPVESSTQISYKLPGNAYVILEVFDLCGRKLQTIVSAEQDRGRHTFIWKTGGLGPGMYLYSLKAGSQQSVRKCIIK